MRSKRSDLTLCALLMAALLAGCGSPRNPEQEHQNQEARLTKLIDDRRYGDVIRIVEDNAEAGTTFNGLLAMAYLGRAGFEPLRFAEQVIAAQAAETTALDRLITGCEARALRRFDQLPTRCLLKRIWAHLPDPDGRDFARARSLFRAAYPDPRSASSEHNTLVALVEAASALARVQRIASRSETDVAFVAAQLVLLSEDATQALERARHATRAVSKLMTGLDFKSLFESDLEGRIRWLEDTGIPLLMEFAHGQSPAELIKDPTALTHVIERLLARLNAG